MYSAIQPLASLLRTKDVDIYNTIFKMHTKVTVFLLLAFSVMVSMTQYFGNPIDCVTDSPYKESIVQYCWIFGTYISKTRYNESIQTVANDPRFGRMPLEDRNYQKYYQWVPFILLFQALLFYIPAFLWKIFDGGKLRGICSNIPNPLCENWEDASKYRIVEFLSNQKFMSYFAYAVKFTICEILNFIIVIGNILLLNWVFEADFFIDYAPAIKTLFFNFSAETWGRHSNRIFPKVAKCDFYMYGPSGSAQEKDALCILSLNIVNEKLFAILWIWFLLLAIISALNLLYKTVLLSCPSYRVSILVARTRLRSNVIKLVTNNGSFGKWFLLDKISSNVNPVSYDNLLIELARKMKKNVSLSQYSTPHSKRKVDIELDSDMDLSD